MQQSLAEIALEDLSIEISIQDIEVLSEHARELPGNTAVFVSAIAGVGFDTQIEIVQAVSRLGFSPVPHIAARRVTTGDSLDRFLARCVDSAGVDKVLIIGGDASESAGPYESSLELIQSGKLEKHGIPNVGLAAYPDGHPVIATEDLFEIYNRKVAALCDNGHQAYAVTQFSFQGESIVACITRLQSRYPRQGVHAGIPGPARLKTLLRFAKLCGVQSSARKLMASMGTGFDLLRGADPWDQLEAIGRYKADTGRSVTAHIFTFGGVAEFMRMLKRKSDAGSPQGETRTS